MRRSICTCDRCGKEITEGVVYLLTCYAEDVKQSPGGGVSFETAAQNTKQNLSLLESDCRELCGTCKDALTDGLFIVG